MAATLLRAATSTRYIFLLSALAFILWSLAISVVPESSALFALLQVDLDQSTAKTMTTPNFTNASLDDVTALVNPKQRPHLGIGIAHAHIYVISLADRQDRREQMEFLRTIQNLSWTVIDAVPGNSTLVNRILDHVALVRTESKKIGTSGFRWPEEIDALSVSHKPLKQSGSETWAEMPPSSKPKPGKFGLLTYPSLPCAIEDNSIPTFATRNDTPEWMTLSPSKIACWHSHILAIRRFVEGQDLPDHRSEGNVAVILEDDIDMERDISTRLSQVWSFLPTGWDIVFLGMFDDIISICCTTQASHCVLNYSTTCQGHCWSDESYYPSLTEFTDTNLHPSYYPKCTHAYALSLSGARRLLQHLRYSPFAYSRALDQAYAWLVRSGRLRSYSIVPSLVVQRKTGSSDISPGSGSGWKEGLWDGVFEARLE